MGQSIVLPTHCGSGGGGAHVPPKTYGWPRKSQASLVSASTSIPASGLAGWPDNCRFSPARRCSPRSGQLFFQFQFGDFAGRGVRERVHDANFLRQLVIGQVLAAESQTSSATFSVSASLSSRIDVVEKGSTGRWPVVFGGSPNTFRLPVSRSLISESRQRAASRRRAGNTRAACAPHAPASFRLSASVSPAKRVVQSSLDNTILPADNPDSVYRRQRS